MGLFAEYFNSRAIASYHRLMLPLDKIPEERHRRFHRVGKMTVFRGHAPASGCGWALSVRSASRESWFGLNSGLRMQTN